MLYRSTRDKTIKIESAQAIKTGLSKDGGLFVPETLPAVSSAEIEAMAHMSYGDRAVFVLSKFLTDFDLFELKECVDLAYNKEKFETDTIAPVYKFKQQRLFFGAVARADMCV